MNRKSSNHSILGLILTALFLLFLYLSSRGYAKAIIRWQKRRIEATNNCYEIETLSKLITITIAMFLVLMFFIECLICQQLTLTGYTFYASGILFLVGLMLQVIFWTNDSFKSIGKKSTIPSNY